MKTMPIIIVYAILFSACSSTQVTLLTPELPLTEDGDTETNEMTETSTSTEDGDDTQPTTTIEGPALAIEMTWIDRETEVDMDLGLVRYRPDGTYAVKLPVAIYGRISEKENRHVCETDSNCASGESCVPEYNENNIQPPPEKVCYAYNEEQIADTCFNYNRDPKWGDQQYSVGVDFINANDDPETIDVRNPAGLYRVVVIKSDELLIEDGRAERDVETTTQFRVKITINGEECVNETFSAYKINTLSKVAEINWTTGTCADVEILDVPSYSLDYKDGRVHNPLDPENPRSIWCDLPLGIGCAE